MAQWQVCNPWRLKAGYTWWAKHFEGEPYYDITNPRHQFNLQSSVSLGRGLELDGALYYVGEINGISQGSPSPVEIDSYVRLDLGLSWKVTDNLEFSVWGQNLLDPGHPELSTYKSPRIAEIPRTFFGKVTWRF